MPCHVITLRTFILFTLLFSLLFLSCILLFVANFVANYLLLLRFLFYSSITIIIYLITYFYSLFIYCDDSASFTKSDNRLIMKADAFNRILMLVILYIVLLSFIWIPNQCSIILTYCCILFDKLCLKYKKSTGCISPLLPEFLQNFPTLDFIPP